MLASVNDSAGVRATRCSCRRAHLWLAIGAVLPILITVTTGTIYRLGRSLGGEKEQLKWLMKIHTMSILSFDWLYPVILSLLVLGLVTTGFTMTYLFTRLQEVICCRSKRGSAANLHSEIARFEARLHSTNGANGIEHDIISSGHGLDSTPSDDDSELSEDGDDQLPNDFLDRRVPNPAAWTLKQRFLSLFPKVFTWRWLHRLIGMTIFVPFAMTAATGGMYIIARDWMYLEKNQYKYLMALHEGRYLESTGTLYVTLVGTSVLGLSCTGAWMLLTRFNWISASSSTSAATSRYALVNSAASSASVFNQPSASTMDRIHKAFDLDHADETEDESIAGSPPHAL